MLILDYNKKMQQIQYLISQLKIQILIVYYRRNNMFISKDCLS